MTLEEKVDALTQTVELIHAMQQGNEQKIDALIAKSDALEDMLKRMFLEVHHVSEVMGALAHNSNVMIATLQDHEFRIGELENPTT